MSGAGANDICPNCGRLLHGATRCPNCGTNAVLYERFSAEGYSVPSNSSTPRWLLLGGTLILLSALVYVVAPRSGGDHRDATTSSTPAPDMEVSRPPLHLPAGGVLAPAPVAPPETAPVVSAKASRSKTTTTVVHPVSSPTPEPGSEADTAFWQRKAARERREAETYEPTEREKAAWDSYRWQDRIGSDDESRATDYVLRRPELTGGRR